MVSHNSWTLFTRTDRLLSSGYVSSFIQRLYNFPTSDKNLFISTSFGVDKVKEWKIPCCHTNRFHSRINSTSIINVCLRTGSFCQATNMRKKGSWRNFFKRFMIMNCLYVIHKFISLPLSRLPTSLSLNAQDPWSNQIFRTRISMELNFMNSNLYVYVGARWEFLFCYRFSALSWCFFDQKIFHHSLSICRVSMSNRQQNWILTSFKLWRWKKGNLLL